MGMSEREYHIKVLENLLSHYKAREQCEGYYDSTLKDNVEALEYAISSIKTDLKYDLMYEGEEIYSKSDMVTMLTEIQLEIEEKYPKCDLCEYFVDYDYDENDISEYRSVGSITDITDLIQQKINSLKEKS